MARASFGWRGIAWVAIAVLVSLVVATFVVPRRSGESAEAEPAPPCPAGFVDQQARGERLLGLLATVDEGRALVDALFGREVRFCFGSIDVPMVAGERVLLFDARAGDAEAAARAGHLLHHVVHGAPLPREIARDAACDALVRDALRREATAYALELRLRRALGVTQARYEFEAAYFAAADARAGERAIEAYLVAHPDGGPGIDALGAAYRERCERARAAAARANR